MPTNASAPLFVGNSPVPRFVAPGEAWREAEAYTATHPGTEIVVGSGGSMLPLYHERTVLVLEHQPMSQLKRGMTIVYLNEEERPVAHVLVARTRGGWLVAGLANEAADDTLVTPANYVGTAVLAFSPLQKRQVAGVRLAAAGVPATVHFAGAGAAQ